MLRWFLAVAAAAVAISSASAAFVVSAVPTVGPSPNGAGGGGNLSTFYANATAGLRANSDAGVAGSASYYIPMPTWAVGGGSINNINATGNGVNGLWNGVVNAAGFNGHLGNFLYMGMAIRTTAGETFSASQVSFSGFNYPAGGVTGFNSIASLTSVLGTGNVFGATTPGGPLSQVTNGATLYSEMYYVGPGFSFDNTNGVDFNSPASLTNLFFNSPFPAGTPMGQLSGSYSVLGNTGTGVVDVNGAPAPATFALMGLGFVGTGLIRRFRKA